TGLERTRVHAAAAVAGLDLLECPDEVAVPEDLAQRDVGDSWSLIGRRAAEQAERLRVRGCDRPEFAPAPVDQLEGVHQAGLERGLSLVRVRAARRLLGSPCRI